MEPETVEGLQAVRDQLAARLDVLERAIRYLNDKIAALQDTAVMQLIQEAASSLRPPEPIVKPTIESERLK